MLAGLVANVLASPVVAQAVDGGASGEGWILVALVTVGLVAIGAPLFVIIGSFVFSCFVAFPTHGEFFKNFNRTEEMVRLADNDALLAIPFFMIAGAIMGRGAIAPRLVEFAMAVFGWLPGGLAVSAIFACAFFAAISGSSPVTVVTIGAVMVPALIKAGYSDSLSHGVVTAAGGLGIVIPPSIPMVVYSIYAGLGDENFQVRVADIFLAGLIPGLLIALMLGVYCMWVCRHMARERFSFTRLWRATLDGTWALFLPVLILGGLYGGLFSNAVDAAAMSVVLAVVIEVNIHKSLKLAQIPSVIREMSVLMGAILIIITVAMGFEYFVDRHGIAEALGAWVAGMDLDPVTFAIVLNVLLLLVGCLLDIISAIVLFVPLLAPIAAQMGFDPLHLGIIFIVNLEIGYLTPPLGLNLFVATTYFQKPFGFVVKSIVPFLMMMLVSLVVITYVPTLSLAVDRASRGESIIVPFPEKPAKVEGEGVPYVPHDPNATEDESKVEADDDFEAKLLEEYRLDDEDEDEDDNATDEDNATP